MAKIAIIVAVAENNVIGSGNAIPWYCPADLQHFKKTTLGYPVLMGRKTYQSLKIKPLPGRQNIIVTRDTKFSAESCDVANSIEQGLQLASASEKIFVIGGEEIYRQTLSRADELYITYVKTSVEGDSFFPEISFNDWHLESEQIRQADEKNPYQMTFKVFKRGQ